MDCSDFKAVVSCFIVCLGGFSHGSMLSWPAEILPQLTAVDSSLGFIDETLLSWIASVNFLGCMLGSLLAAFLQKFVSQKIMIAGSALLAGVSWLTVGLSFTPFMLCIARILLGVGNAMLMSLIPPYISSIAPERCAGFLSSAYALFLGLGLVYSVAAGKALSWELTSIIACGPPLVLFASVPFLTYKAEEDLPSRLTRGVQVQSGPDRVTVNHPLMLFFFLASCFILSGLCPLSVFIEFLFKDERTFTVSNITLASNICQVVGGLVGAVAIDIYGRKPVLRLGGWICLLSNILISLYFSTVSETNECPTAPGSALCWTPAVACCMFFLGFGAGLGNIFFVLMGELVPAKKAGKIIPLVTFYLNMLQFIVIKTFMSAQALFGLTSLFFMQAGINIFFLFGQGTWLPETKPTGESNEYERLNDSSSQLYGSVIQSNIAVDRYTTAESSGSSYNRPEVVLNDTAFYTRLSNTINTKEERRRISLF